MTEAKVSYPTFNKICVARKDGAQSIANNTITPITSWSLSGTDAALFNSGTGLYTAPADGLYALNGILMFTNANSSTTSVRVYINGSAAGYNFDYGNWSAYSGMSFAGTFYLATGDTLGIRINQGSGAVRNIHSDGNTNWMTITRFA